MLRDTPPDWHPKLPEDWASAFAMADAIAWATKITGISVRSLVDPCRGKWDDWYEQVWGTIYGFNPATHAINKDSMSRPNTGTTTRVLLVDVMSAFVGQVLLPCLALDDPRLHDTESVEADLQKLFRPGAALLFGEASFNGIIERGRDWHHIRDSIDLAIDRLTLEKRELHSWPAGMKEARYDGKLVVRPLTTHRQLIAEGSAHRDIDGIAGLNHCVGGFGYVNNCLKGVSRILSIRSITEDGSETRLSTAEISVSRRNVPHFSIRQHSGKKNSEPPEAAKTALDAYVADLEAGTKEWSAFEQVIVPMTTPSHVGNYDATIPSNVEACLRLWEPLLPKKLRRLTLEAFADLAKAAVAAAQENEPD